MSDLQSAPHGFIAKTRAKITATLTPFGAGAGIATGVALTYFGNVISGYPIKPPLDTYLWHASLFGILGALVGPPLVWNAMRRVPLWRAVVEPAAAALFGAVAAMVISPALFIPFVVTGGLGAVWRLNRVYREPDAFDLEPAMLESAPEGSS